ncbi:response regulator transcription factor [Microvirga thermotolerans]|uniref:DNA-binding response regulator n=1 Tax=Microvirga thermotolerans TaxID=2651334 RepID=A0A5P9JZI3_9HYPH|nr:response regulator transcription factor [Microvirga thermotolerans]QFU17641.1 DNA-binding response regulator [Microvirga thermotolerans]QFU17669.1 DNA-binding response regulator [Microvirga thermotolerans]
MYIVVDERQMVTAAYVAGFHREGVSSLGLYAGEFKEWLNAASSADLDAVQGFLLGEFQERIACAEAIRRHSRAPIIALSEIRSLEQTLELFTAKFDDVVRKPVHVREILARSEAIWRRVNAAAQTAPAAPERLKVYFDGRDPEIDGVSLPLPRRERHILEYLVRNRGRRLTKTQIFNAIYGIYSNDVEESVIEGHVSKLRKKLRARLGYDPIEAKRYIGYTFVG